MGYAFADGWGFNFFAGDLGEVGFFKFVKASSGQRAARVDCLEDFQCGNVYSEFA